MLIRHDDLKPLEFDDLKIIDYTAGLKTNSSFAEITVPPGVSHKLSWSNRSDKYYYIVRGDVSFTVDNESFNLLSGDVFIIPKGSRFKYSNKGTQDAVLILVHTPGFKLEYEEFE